MSKGDIHSHLEEIDFQFNKIDNVMTHTFVDLPSLITVNLRDNFINNLERRSFMNMNKLKYLSLRGNELKNVQDEVFQVGLN